MKEALHQHWRDLLSTWAVSPDLADPAFEDVCQRYAEPARFYHTLEHIRSMIEVVESLSSHARNLNAVLLAVWLHDVIYDSQASDNEERSADYADRLCANFSIPDGGRVAALIRKTKTHDAADDPDAQVLLDADLAILGAGENDYRDYAEKIRREYAWVPEPAYREGRGRVLQIFLDRPRIYHFLSDREAAARRNLAAEIARLMGV